MSGQAQYPDTSDQPLRRGLSREKFGQLRSVVNATEKRRYAIVLVLMVFGTILEGLGVGVVPGVVMALSEPDQLYRIPVLGEHLAAVQDWPVESLLYASAFVLVGLFALKALFLSGMHAYLTRTTELHRVRLATELYRSYLHAPLVYHLTHNSAEILRNVTAEVNEVVNGVALPLLNIAFRGSTLVLLVALISLALPATALLALGVILLGGAGILLSLRRYLRRQGLVATRARRHMLQSAQEGLITIVPARLRAREEWLADRFADHVTRFSGAQSRTRIVRKSLPHIMETLSVVGFFVVLMAMAAGRSSLEGVLPELSLVGIGMLRLRQAVNQTLASYTQMQFGLPALPHVANNLGRFEVPTRRAASSVDPLVGGVEFRGVTYTYPGTRVSALKGVSLCIERGQSVALLGTTGSGKSTLINVLLGLLEPESGSVSCGGVDIRTNLPSWRRGIGYVPQDIVLIDDTILSNITLGQPAECVDEALLERAIDVAQLAPVLGTQPQGLETVVGERGQRLSGGERQRVGIARALYADPQLLVLDEATSALDPETEQGVIAALRDRCPGLTVVMIAHRHSTLEHCARVFMLEHGAVVDVGSLAELASRHSGVVRNTG